MPVTINANGLSIVHQGSEGEANASLPDVCKTQCGPAVVPIPYGNNAKSADLADGTTTVSADGGNSIAIDGSKFSQSTGDASGDKKGIVSGTIEGEAQFVTSSPTVIIEGKGVARHSDQMTMNKANTMCLGVQNPSVSVEESPAEASQVDIKVRYPNGTLLTNAPFQLTDESSAAIGDGTLCEQGKGSVDGLQPGKVKLHVAESNDAFVVAPKLRTNPHYREQLQDQDFFELASKGRQTFWQPQRIASSMMGWGSMGKDLTTDRYFHDMLQLETQAYFDKGHPSYELDKIGYATIQDIAEQNTASIDTVVVYTLPMMVEEGDILSVLFRLAPHETTDRMLAYMRARGKGNPQSYLSDYDWDTTKKQMTNTLQELLNKVTSRIETLGEEARRLNYTYLSADIFDAHISDLNAYIKGLPDRVAESFSRLADKAQNLLADVSNVQVIKAHDNVYSAEAGVVEAVVNTTANVDVVDPYLNEEPGIIVNVQPIYPVRFGYWNFGETTLAPQAPPTLTQMQSATNVEESGGYLLRLLREGWIYIKEEQENGPLQMFKYCQVVTATGVIEKFEKYYFTNQENAQDGLTLDESSGSSFYPFAFVSPSAQKISIAYSEHEWSATIIDAINSDESLRAKSMQSVDLTSPSSDFSLEASQDNLTALVEDYRPNDKKWLAGKDSTKPQETGYDALTTTASFHLSAQGITKVMQTSSSTHKEGTLVTLFDPVGRQLDIVHVLATKVAEEQAYVANNIYPSTIGHFAQACLNSEQPTVQKAAQENLALQPLEDYFAEVEEQKNNNKLGREALLELLDYFVAGAGATDELGSLTSYLKHFFVYAASGVDSPEAEVNKLLLLTAELFDGVTASEEGTEAMNRWVDQAFISEQDPSDAVNVVEIALKATNLLFTQCQNALPWDKAPIKLTLSLGAWFASLHAQAIDSLRTSASESKLSAYQGLERFAKEVLPDMIALLYGVEFTGEQVELSVEEAEKIIQNLAKKGKSHIDPNQQAKLKLKLGKKLYEWSEVLANRAQKNVAKQVIRVSEIRAAKTAPLDVKALLEKAVAKTTLHLSGAMLDAGFAYWSFWGNLNSIQEILAQSSWEHADPVSDTGFIYRTAKMVGSLTAISVDTATMAKYSLKVTNRILPKLNSKLAAEFTPNLLAYQQRLGTVLAETTIKGLVASANIIVAGTSGYSAYRSALSGNTGAAVGHGMQALASLYFFVAVFVPAIAITSVVITAFATLISGAVIADAYTKKPLENLLFSCFWGKSGLYPFWAFEDGGEIAAGQDRIQKVTKNHNSVSQRYFDSALQIESQEFFNFFYQPSVTITDHTPITYQALKLKHKVSYQFILPDFKAEVSQLHGVVYNQISQQSYPIWITPQPNPAATEALKAAILAAINDPSAHSYQKEGLHLNVEVEFDQAVTLFWSYEPNPGLVVPQRYLTADGKVSHAYIGMQDEQPNDTIWGQ